MLGKLFRTKPEPIAVPVPRVAENERIYAVGDIHGRADLLNEMFKRIAMDAVTHEDERNPRIILLGDYIDRGDNSRDVIDLMISVSESLPEGRLTFLLGNHEAALLSFLQDPTERSEWLRFGGLQTLSSYGVAPPKSNPSPEDLVAVADALRTAMGKEHIDFMMSFQRYIKSGDVVFVHAGLDTGASLNEQDDEAMLWGRSDFIETGGIDGLRVIHGHYDASEPVMLPSRVCVDTGAYYSGRLTAIRLDEGEKLITVDVLDIMD